MAFDLMLRDGYERTTIQAIMEANQISRTTFFRYLGSKGSIVWGEFEHAVQRLRASLDSMDNGPTLTCVRIAVTRSTQLSEAAAPETWLDRFRIMDRDPALVAETAAHWKIWADEISSYIGKRAGLDSRGPVPAAIGGAVQAVYVSVLRSWIAAPRNSEVDVAELDRALRPICEALQTTINPAS